MSQSAELPARSLPELLEIAHGDIEGGHGQSNGRYFDSLLEQRENNSTGHRRARTPLEPDLV